MSATAQRPRNVRRDFTFQSKAITAVKRMEKDASGNEVETYYLEAPASSTVKDRMGDIMSLASQKKMEAAAKAMTIWLNHSYDVPEDIFGTCEKSELVAANDATDGACFDLIIRVKCYVDNPRVLATWRAVDKGIKLGFSIGGYVPDDGFEFKEQPNGDFVFVINDIDLYEISVVGIPAQQRAIIDDVAKGLRKKFTQRRAQEAIVKAHEEDGRMPNFGEGDREPTDAEIDADAERQKEEKERLDDATVPDAQNNPDLTPSEAPGSTEDVQVVQGEKSVPQASAGEKTAGSEGDQGGLVEAGIEGLVVRVPGNGDVHDYTAKALTVPEKKKIRAAVDHLHKAVAHGMCDDSKAHVGNAHACLMTLIPNNPDEDESSSSDDLDDVTRSAMIAEHKKVSDELSEVQKALIASKADADALSKQIVEKRAELSDLDAKIAKAKVTPLGRQTKSLVRGGNLSGENTADPERRKMHESTILAELSAQLAGTPQDARARSSQ